MICKRLLTMLVVIAFCAKVTAQQKTADIYSTLKHVADWQINELQTKPWKYPATDWTNGALYTGMMHWASIANNDRYIHFLKSIGDSLKWEGGPERFFADDYCVGQTWSQLFMLYKDSAMIKPMMSIGDDIISRPHTESLLWNFDGGLHNREWAWCDALYMGPPMLAYLSTATKEKKYLDIADKLWWRSTHFLYDKSEHLYFRDSRYFDKKEKNGQKVFWSRGNGWVIAGIARILDNMPANYPTRKGYEKIFKDMAKRIAALQQPDGTWHASLLDPASYPIKETSGTAFFTYAFAWGINNGYLSYNEYMPVINKAWTAMKECIHPDGKLGFVQVPGASPDKVSYDDTEVYGVGALLLAGTELFKLNFNKEKTLVRFSVQNTTSFNRSEEMVELNWNKLQSLGFTAANTTIINAQSGEEVPSQLVYQGKPAPQSLIFQSGTGIGSTAFYLLNKQKTAAYKAKTYGRLVPERKDDFTWENDKIAFRMYGPALQADGEISNGIDVWAKRTNELVIDKWYKQNDYHKDHGEGLDFYGVGKTLGAGGIAPFVNNQLYPSKNFISYKILDNGPLRTSFILNYDTWNAAGINIKESKTITIDAGSFLNKVSVNYSFKGKNIAVATGIANLPGEGKSWYNTDKAGILAYEQPAQENGIIRVGVIVPAKAKYQYVALQDGGHYKHTGHYLLISSATNMQPFQYYQGACWNKEGSFASLQDWTKYLENKYVAAQKPLAIKFY